MLNKGPIFLGLMIEPLENHKNPYFSGLNLLAYLITFMIFGPSSNSEFLNNFVAVE
jgi:hypothetical protein